MRIPTSVAQQIGAAFSAAQVNERAAIQLTKASSFISSAAVAYSKGDSATATTDARSAAALLGAIDTTATGFDNTAAYATIMSAESVNQAIQRIAADTPSDVLYSLSTAALNADRGVLEAKQAAVSYRAFALDLQSQYSGFMPEYVA